MYRIDKFLEYYKSLEGVDTEISPGVWVHDRPLPFYYGVLTKEFWRERRKTKKQRKKDAKAVLKGEAIAVTWKNN
jgi:hypothetical protein